MLTLKVFLSSPGDVAEERQLAREALEELEKTHLLRDRVHFEIIAWDDPHAPDSNGCARDPQASVNRFAARPKDCDLTLVILWSGWGPRLRG